MQLVTAVGIGLVCLLSIIAVFKNEGNMPVSDPRNIESSTYPHGLSLLQTGHRSKVFKAKPKGKHEASSRVHAHPAATVKSYDHVQLLTKCACQADSEKSTNVCFEQVSNSFQKKYSPHGREMNLLREKLSLDFELETGAHLTMNPELLLIRGGINLGTDPFPNVSQYFEVGLDGMGRRNKLHGYRQQIFTTMELESVPMTVADVQNSGFLHDLQSFLTEMGHDHTVKKHVPGSTSLSFIKGHDEIASCLGCHIQWTVGLPLAWVPALFSKAGSAKLKGVMQRLNNLEHCQQRTCSLEYKGLVSLAAWTLQAAKNCQMCNHPKRCMNPWLVRTHFGDLVKHVRRSVGEDALSRFPQDVLEAANVKADSPVFPKGIVDYLHFSELAEIGQLVVPRSSNLGESSPTTATKCMPTDGDGLRLLAKRMLDEKAQVDQRLRSRGCGVYGVDDPTLLRFTAQTWLQEMLQGRDIMADSDSPIAQKSYSKLVWKSMGSWRMAANGGDRVFLECRNPGYCLGKATPTNGPVARIRNVAEAMQAFEDEMAGTV